ncbi:MAG: serine hydrolase [Candidatus Binatia bacterium]|nr:serine hydrolase [Candidatus Binatia bacterium]
MMRALRWLLGAILLLVTFLLGFVLWIAQPWAEHRGMRTWPVGSSIQLFGGDENREGLAEVFRSWDESPPFSRLVAAPEPHRFPRDLRPLDVRYELEGETYTLEQYLEAARVQGLLVMKDGEVVFETYPQQTGPEDRYHLWSASKSFTGTLIGMALYEGRIESLDDRIDKYAPQFVGTAYGEASIRDVMRMSSGVDFFHHCSGSETVGPNRSMK